MLTEILRFELSRHFRAISTWIYFLLLGGLAFLAMMAAAGTFDNFSFNFGDGGKVLANSPYSLYQFVEIFACFGLLIIGAVMGRTACQDFQQRSEPFFFTAPISKSSYLGGRFLAALLILLFIFSSIGLGLFLGTHIPGADHTRIGPNHWAAYLAPYAGLLIPNVVIMGTLFFSVASLARRIAPVYMTAVILVAAYLIAVSLTENIEERLIAALADPFGITASDRVTRYWTIAERNTRLVGVEGALLGNRVLWLIVASVLAGFTLWKFRMAHGAAAEASRAKSGLRRYDGIAAGRTVLGRLVSLHFAETVKNIYFAVIVLAGIGFLIAAAVNMGDIYGTPTYPVTYQVLEMTTGNFSLFMLIILTFYSGELVWRERDLGAHEIIDSLPLQPWTPFLSKLLALFLVPVLLQVVVMAAGMVIQLCKGYTHFEPVQYVETLFGAELFNYWLVAALAITVQAIVSHKYLGHFVMVLYYLAFSFMRQFGLEHPLYRFGATTGYVYSDMNGFGRFTAPLFWFDAYWAAFAVLMAVVCRLLWPEGLASGWRPRLYLARRRFGGRERRLAAGAAIAFATLGGFLFYNTNVLHIFRTAYQAQELRAQYEKRYKQYEKLSQPRITSANLRIDLYPESGGYRVHGHYGIANKTSQPVDRVLVSVGESWKVHGLTFTPAAMLEKDDRPVGLRVYRLGQSFPPGATGALDFDLEFAPKGFTAYGPVKEPENGMFLNDEDFAHLGYSPDAELSDENIRRKHGLKPKPRMADINDMDARRNMDTSRDADWITADVVLSTSPDQIAIAPGELLGEWVEAGRRVFHYRALGKAQDFICAVSARYRVVRDKWNDVDLAIYYHPSHEYNLEKMRQSMRQTLDYCTRNFSPYQNKTLRVLEFPRYDGFAQSFLASVPYSESIGFIAKVDPSDEKDVDYPFYITAHEVAHQWWGHQVVGGNVQGAGMVSESLAEYTAMMVMKHQHGPEQMKRFLKYEMDRYLAGRSSEKYTEQPLVRCEGQGYIHYSKGSVVFYALQDYIGEDTVNRALRSYLNQVAWQEPPYTTALDLLAKLREVTPPQYAYLIADMFESITLYENRAVAATYRELGKGKYEVKLKVAARKLKSSDQGVEKEVALADWIDIGVLDAKGKPLYLERHKIEKPETDFQFTVNGIPAKAGIDPWNKLVDRKPDDNVIAVSKVD
jgi:hypothetical protein